MEEQGNQGRLETCGARIPETAGQVDQWKQQQAELETCDTGSLKPVGQVDQRERSLGTCGTGKSRPVAQVEHGKKGIATGRPKLAEGSSGKKPMGRKWVHRRKTVGVGNATAC